MFPICSTEIKEYPALSKVHWEVSKIDAALEELRKEKQQAEGMVAGEQLPTQQILCMLLCVRH